VRQLHVGVHRGSVGLHVQVQQLGVVLGDEHLDPER
jgi:hypothetical protein